MALCVRVTCIYAAQRACNYFYHSQQGDRKFTKYKILFVFEASEDLGQNSNCRTKDCVKRETNFMRKPETKIQLLCERESWMTTAATVAAAVEEEHQMYKCK